MANASCMAGMAFANAFLGVNHSMAHKLGAFHHLPHGVANAVILTEVMRYNAAEVPTKMGTFSQYQYPHALARYAELGRFAGCTGKDDKEVFENFIAKLEELKEKILLAETLVTVEDLYRPYRPKRRTRATIAKEKGLEPLAAYMMLQQAKEPLEETAKQYISEEKRSKDRGRSNRRSKRHYCGNHFR